MITRMLVANRGEIACRIFRTCEVMGIEKLAVYSDADAGAKHIRMADRAIRIGPGPAKESYLDTEAILIAAAELGADAVHPGYGFLAESAPFARAVEKAGMTWIGPTPESMDAMSEKVPARRVMQAAGVPVVPGSDGQVSDLETAAAAAERIGFPVIVKASAGGGGIGMTMIEDLGGLEAALESARSRAERYFANPAVYLEKYIRSGRHIEVQVLGLNSGRIVVVGDRDCSTQRRHQKVLEEAPCPDLSESERGLLHNAAAAAAAAIDYRGAGTIEMIMDRGDRNAYFLEMNTRLQVEHPVTELVTGLDLVAAQVRISQGENLDAELAPSPQQRGHAIEFRIYAEDPIRYLPGPGAITTWAEPAGEGIRVDSGYSCGDEVTPYYDPLMAKLCVHAPDRNTAIDRLVAAAAAFKIHGPKNNLPLVERITRHPNFRAGRYDTTILSDSTPQAPRE